MPIHGLPASSTPAHPAHFDIERAIRPNILSLRPYRCARDDYQQGVLLDANENALGHSIPLPAKGAPQANGDAPQAKAGQNADADVDVELKSLLELDLHRYPDPAHNNIKERIAALRGIPGVDHVFLGVGSDEVIDLLIRVACAPGREGVLITPPTYGMYAVCAQVNDVRVVRCDLELSGGVGEGGGAGRFSARVDAIKKAISDDPSIRLIFLCSPGNPTGTSISLSSLRALLEYPAFTGIVVVDEAYIDFAGADASAVPLVREYANLCVMQTLSKSFGLAAIRLGIAIAQPPLIQVLSNTKAPYNISAPTAHLALSALSPPAISLMRSKVASLLASRAQLITALAELAPAGLGAPLGAGDANFVLIPVLDATGVPDSAKAERVYRRLAEEMGVVVRYRGAEPGCAGCLRITVGTESENSMLLKRLTEVLSAL